MENINEDFNNNHNMKTILKIKSKYPWVTLSKNVISKEMDKKWKNHIKKISKKN
jgi:hypothetical protein